MYNPLVSVIIPVYNGSNYLAEAIDSALAQDYKNIEIIVVNDGSMDDGASEKIALTYGNKIKYYYKENGGCASALNYGMQVMIGEWYSWLSHDDLYMPTKISSELKCLQVWNLDPATTVLASDSILIDKDGKEVYCPFRNSRGLLNGPRSYSETILKKTFNGCGLLIPKTILDSQGYFDEQYKHLLDREYWMRIALAGNSFFVIKDPLVKSRVHSAQVTFTQKALLFNEEEVLIEKNSSEITKDFSTRDYAVYLCCFCYKRKHYEQGKKLYRYLKENKLLKLKDYMCIAKYIFIGKTKNAVGELYRTLIRK